MTEHVPQQVTMEDVHGAFSTYAATRYLTHRSTILSAGPPAWVATGYTNTYPAEALRLELTDSPDEALAEERAKVGVVQALALHGARVVEYLDEPQIVQSPNGAVFIGTASRFLPGADGTPREYGEAVGTMHNASTQLDLSRVPVLDQLAKAQQTFTFLFEREQAGSPVASGDVCFDESWLATAGMCLAGASEAQQRMLRIAEQKHRPLVVVQEDTHNEQYGRDHKGVVRLFDIDATKSVPEVDAGRAQTQWENRLSFPRGFTEGYLNGHARVALPEVQFDPDIQTAANIVSLTRFSFAMLNLGVRRYRAQQPGADWFLQEGAHRVRVIRDHGARWHGLDAAMKRALGL